jgi:hypothetical protein
MTRLAQHILAAARTQGTTVPQQRMVMEVAQAFPQFGGLETQEEPQEPEAPHYATNGGAPNGGGNGAGHHHEPAVAEPAMQVETVVEEYTEIAARHEEMLAPAQSDSVEEDVEAEASRASIAQRFAARRERRRSNRPSSGGSLRDRLRGLVAEQPKT